MDPTQLTMWIVASLGACVGSATLYYVKRVDARLDRLNQDREEIKVKAAVQQERHNALITAIDRNTKDIGRLTASVEKVWDCLQAQKIAKPRVSDQMR